VQSLAPSPGEPAVIGSIILVGVAHMLMGPRYTYPR
jgi:hypothetical protein